MQYLNNDMDELMRQAAEQYPLQPTGADWEKVSQQLKETNSSVHQKTKNWKGFAFLISFLLASLICNKFYFQPSDLSKEQRKTEQSTLSNNNDLSNEKTEQVIDSRERDEEQNVSVFSYLDQYQKKHHQPIIGARNYSLTIHKVMLSDATQPVLPKKEHTTETGVEMKMKDFPEQQKIEMPEQTIELDNKTTSETIIKPVDSSIPKKSSIESLEKISNPAIIKREKLYTSLLIGPDISSVKSQQWNTGYSIGAVAGYNFSKRWSVETGIFWSRKNYYSKGAYFKTEKVALPYHSKIIDAEGYCNMFEIPLNIRFQFIQKGKNALYALIGSSSYLMKNEEYDYNYVRYNVQYNKTNYYKNASKDWLSVLNMSIGYEHKLGSTGKLRFEPYMRFPLNGVGIGSIPLTSTGFYVGFTYPIR